MSQSQGKQLADIINTLIRITPRDTYEMVASQIDTSVDDVTKQIQDSVEFDHPYITDLSKAFSEQLTPLLHAMLISASQSALEKGHQAAMLQHQDDEEELVSQLESQISELKRLLSKQQQDSETLEESLEAKEQQVAALQKELDVAKTQQGDASAQGELLADLAKQNQQLKEKLDATERVLHKQKEQNEIQSTKLKQLIDERRHDETQNVELASKLKAQVAQLTTELANTKASQQSLAEDAKAKAELEQQVAELKSKLAKLENEGSEQSEQLAQENQHLNDSIAKLNEKIKELSSQNESHLALIDTVNKDKQSTIDELKQQLAEFVAEKDSMAHSNAELEIVIAKLEQQNKGISTELEALRQENISTQEKADAAQQLLDAKMNELNEALSLSQEAQQQAEQEKAKLAAQLASFESQQEQHEQAVERLRKQIDEQAAALNLEQGRNTSLLSRLEKESQQARGAYESIRSENLGLNDKIEELEAKVTEFKLKFEYAQKQLSQ